MTTENLIDQVLWLAYRWVGYAMANWADAAAMLALVFS